MKKIILTIFFLVLFSHNLIAQSDTLICFEVRTGKISIIIPSQIITPDESGITDWNIGALKNIHVFDNTPPENTFPSSGFTYFEKTPPEFDVNSFPLSTTVSLHRYVAAQADNWCTGTMISDRLVLTCAHGIWYQDNFVDSILAMPGYNNGMHNQNFGTSISKKYYVPKRFVDGTGWIDIALIELNEPIGELSGWMGISYNENQEFFEDAVMHKFIYPGNMFFENQELYCGDTMYYNYGTIDRFDFAGDLGLGYAYPSIIGMSGSSIFYNGNSGFYIFGTLSASSEQPPVGPMTYHFPIKKNIFYAIKNVMDILSSTEPNNKFKHANDFVLYQNYPNPFNPVSNIKYEIANMEQVNLRVYNILGREVQILVDEVKAPGTYEVQFNGTNLASGIYFYRLQSRRFTQVSKMILLK